MIQALSKSVRVSPRKLRIIADEVKKMRIGDALTTLENSPKQGAVEIKKTLDSAVANAKQTKNLGQDDLVIKAIEVNQGPKFKRWRAISRGSAHGYAKKTSHIRIILNEIKTVSTKKEEPKNIENNKTTKSNKTKENK